MIGGDIGGIENGQPLGRGEPKQPIFGFAGARLKSTRAGLGSNALGFSIAQAMNWLCLAIGAAIQLRFADAQDAAMRAHPEITGAIIDQMGNASVRQSLDGADADKLSAAKTRQSIIGGANP